MAVLKEMTRNTLSGGVVGARQFRGTIGLLIFRKRLLRRGVYPPQGGTEKSALQGAPRNYLQAQS